MHLDIFIHPVSTLMKLWALNFLKCRFKFVSCLSLNTPSSILFSKHLPYQRRPSACVWSFGIILCKSLYMKIEYRFSRCKGAMTVLHLSFMSMNNLKLTGIVVFTLLSHVLHPGDHTSRNYVFI